MPTLMREARDAYRDAVRRALAGAGCDDIPRNAVFVLAGLDHGGPEPAFSPQADVIASLGLSKQAASQLIDTLVLRGYLTRDTDPADRRRVTIDLTDRGHAAAAAIYAGTVAIDAELAGMLSPAEMAGLRAGLAALGQIKERGKEAMIGPRTRLTEFSPIFGVKDLHQVLAHYESLALPPGPMPKATSTGSPAATGSGCTWPRTPIMGRRPGRALTCLSRTPTPCTRSGAGRESAGSPTG